MKVRVGDNILDNLIKKLLSFKIYGNKNNINKGIYILSKNKNGLNKYEDINYISHEHVNIEKMDKEEKKIYNKLLENQLITIEL